MTDLPRRRRKRPAPLPPPERPPGARPSINYLADLIVRSRFPEDTGAGRYRQLAVVFLIYAAYKRDEPPTAATLAREVGSDESQVFLIARLLFNRGVLLRIPAHGYLGAPNNTILDINPDAAAALNRAHIEATGAPINLN